MNENLYKLKLRQNYPLWMKLYFTKLRIKQWYDFWDGQVYVSFSGGKDSTVLLDIVRSLYPEVPAVFANTGREYKEIYTFIRTIDNVIWLKPKMPFEEVIKKYGYPVVSKEVSQKISEVRTTKSEKLRHKRLYGDDNKYKSGKIPNKWHYLIDAPFKISHKCCEVLKKQPFKQFEKETQLKPIIGTMVDESHLRRQKYAKNSCNSFGNKRPESNPIAHWATNDIWEYIRSKNIPYSEIYNMGYDRTGCKDCMFGVHLDGDQNRFDRMKITHPKQYDYCMNKLGLKEVLNWIFKDRQENLF